MGQASESSATGAGRDARVPRFWNVPNSLSVARLVLAGVVFALIDHAYYLPALVVFVIAALTDALDGYLARLLNQATAIGRQLDPLVDKVIVAGALIHLLPVPRTGLAPWMITLIVTRELIVQAIRSMVEGKGVAFGARTSGKLKTVLQCASITGILLSLGTTLPGPWLWVRDALTWSAVGLTLYSGLIYVFAAWPHLREPS